ncbi:MULTISPECIES: antA/AntB antirepressor family protein [Glaesserella]|uniref:Phage antirepressor Ant n=1 Tax=Glaesserella australis TaxID=2094024 RepID=A0A328BZF4_9PAST|nr:MULTISPECIES: antA/AntB antirepressor family protein [Glaesserella]AUI65200.1 phage antirepressor Ant [Glaesserella sp. 15-184]RAL18472.1 phage antirepressor Ant [Glaesserella australis]
MPITTFNGVIANQTTLLVNARELHTRLQVGKDFSTWIKDRIANYGFQEGLDFSPVSGKSTGFFGRPSIEYHLTLDMAKELCMLERSELGRQARRYFIEQEKNAKALAEQNAKLLAQIPPFLLNNPDQTTMLIERAHQAFFIAYPEAKEILRYRGMGLSNPEISKLLNLGKKALGTRLAKMFELGLIERRATNSPNTHRLLQNQHNQLSLGLNA